MSAFSEAALVDKLMKVNETQESITFVSHWIMYHRKHAAMIAETWAKEIRKVAPQRKLLFLYICNDVVQVSKKKGSEFTNAFLPILPDVLEHIAQSAPADVTAKVLRTVNIWGERLIFPADAVSELRAKLGGAGTKRDSSGQAVSRPSAGSLPTPSASAAPRPAQAEGGIPQTLSTLSKRVGAVDRLVEEARTAPPAGGAHFASLESQVQAVPLIYYEEDALREFRGKPEAERAAAELQTSIIALTNHRNLLQVQLDARNAVVSELQRMLAVEEALARKNAEKLMDANDKLDKVRRTHASLVRSSNGPVPFSTLPRTPPGEPPGLPSILASLTGVPASTTATAAEEMADPFADFINTPPSDGAPEVEPPTPPDARAAGGSFGALPGLGAFGMPPGLGAAGEEDEDGVVDLAVMGLGSGGIGARR
ncbi:RNA polymerase II-binding domain-containing protein [Hyaloraphidium curvatum]|nr:RNA polymerase II-binding domain-containing protein [Hyaloraphidium curvatum]